MFVIYLFSFILLSGYDVKGFITTFASSDMTVCYLEHFVPSSFSDSDIANEGLWSGITGFSHQHGSYTDIQVRKPGALL